MKKYPISGHAHGSTFYLTLNRTTYAIPKEVAEKYTVKDKQPKKSKRDTVSANVFCEKLYKKFTKAAVLLKGLRVREDLSQAEFAKKINVSQTNLSKMENGHRSIGRTIAKRIEKVFGTDYRYFLE